MNLKSYLLRARNPTGLFPHVIRPFAYGWEIEDLDLDALPIIDQLDAGALSLIDEFKRIAEAARGFRISVWLTATVGPLMIICRRDRPGIHVRSSGEIFDDMDHAMDNAWSCITMTGAPRTKWRIAGDYRRHAS